jgi:hypothetical protein
VYSTVDVTVFPALSVAVHVAVAPPTVLVEKPVTTVDTEPPKDSELSVAVQVLVTVALCIGVVVDKVNAVIDGTVVSRLNTTVLTVERLAALVALIVKV